MSRCHALIPAAGVGARAGAPIPKQYAEINGLPMLAHTLRAFVAAPGIASVHLVISPEDEWLGSLAKQVIPEQVRVHRSGGITRADSVANGLRAMAGEAATGDWVLVHDAARPCITPAMIAAMIDELQQDAVGGLLALPVAETVKRADSSQRVAQTLPRDGLWLAQTPQMFRLAMLADAYARFPEVTDEAGAMERAGHVPRLVTGDARNIKVTYPADFALAALYLKDST
ncbi:MAG TPA: 2-C-methyl-D-erythritol 4-phosphate cytidylyltransferase [Burkholderiales bacterium]|jgi:2-C-methyl-D-erythritol 4-phosphate cytidylyltransferase|nr:2-C-methyl-D-erythritol 4-phosphate cytidylyltransferase [Burkholderiales bacterium]